MTQILTPTRNDPQIPRAAMHLVNPKPNHNAEWFSCSAYSEAIKLAKWLITKGVGAYITTTPSGHFVVFRDERHNKIVSSPDIQMHGVVYPISVREMSGQLLHSKYVNGMAQINCEIPKRMKRGKMFVKVYCFTCGRHSWSRNDRLACKSCERHCKNKGIPYTPYVSEAKRTKMIQFFEYQGRYAQH